MDSRTSTPAASPTAKIAARSRTLLLLAISLNLLLIVGRVLLYPGFWSHSGAMTYLLEPVALLLVYAAVAVWVTADTGSDRRRALLYGTAMGLVSGGLWIVNLALETFANLPGLGLLATAPFLLGGLLLWGVAGFRTAWLAGSLPAAVVAAIWSAMVCVLPAIMFGLVLTYTSLPHLAHDLVADPDFLRSHWHDLRAFAIANSFDSAFSHLLGGLVIGSMTGTAGGLLGRVLTRRMLTSNDTPCEVEVSCQRRTTR